MKRFVLMLCLLASPAFAGPPSEVVDTMRDAKLSGSADVRYFGFNLYQADLWQGSKGYALSLTYKRKFSAQELSGASIKEIARMEDARPEKFADLAPLLTKCFADVNKGDRITGASTGANTAKFYFNGKERCAVNYPQFRDRFFAIWLGPETRDPKSRDRLLGKIK